MKETDRHIRCRLLS